MWRTFIWLLHIIAFIEDLWFGLPWRSDFMLAIDFFYIHRLNLGFSYSFLRGMRWILLGPALTNSEWSIGFSGNAHLVNLTSLIIRFVYFKFLSYPFWVCLLKCLIGLKNKKFPFWFNAATFKSASGSRSLY